LPVIEVFFQIDYEELLKLWLADQVTALVEEDTQFTDEVLKLAKMNLKKSKNE